MKDLMCVCERERRTGQFQNGEDELVMQFVSAARVEVGSCYLACWPALARRIVCYSLSAPAV